MYFTMQGSDEEEDDDSTESGAKVINNPLDEATPRPVEDDSDSGSDTEGPGAHTRMHVLEYPVSVCPHVL